MLGTGKTVCLSNRMASDRKEKMKHNGKIISQLFVCRSRRLCEAVKRFQSEYYNSPEVGADVAGDERFKNVNNAVFRTLDEFIDRVDSVVSREKNPSTNTYQDFKYVSYFLSFFFLLNLISLFFVSLNRLISNYLKKHLWGITCLSILY